MKQILLTLLLAVLFTTARAQYFPIDTARLNNAYEALSLNPQSYDRQMEFFEAFPNNWYEYYGTYRYCDKKDYDLSMYDIASEHVRALENCTAINDTLFSNRLIALSVGAAIDADAPNYLLMLLHSFMNRKSEVLVYSLSKIAKGHQMQFWQFYWSCITDSDDKRSEFKKLYGKYRRKYPEMMKRMAVAFENFHNGVDFISTFQKLFEFY